MYVARQTVNKANLGSSRCWASKRLQELFDRSQFGVQTQLGLSTQEEFQFVVVIGTIVIVCVGVRAIDEPRRVAAMR